MHQRLKRISPSSLGATCAIIYFLIGLLIGIFGVVAGLSGASVTLSGPVTFSGRGETLMAVSVAYPFLSAFIAWISGTILALIYNFTTRYTKGIQIEVEESGPLDF